MQFKLEDMVRTFQFDLVREAGEHRARRNISYGERGAQPATKK
ncbi:MAG TPA: hypothetical protein PKD79_02730 [Candidatus Doudnabacteria bacterium]|nr:hypothetical protein [Candidatus Doudnabacteria bacterium]